MHPRLQKEGHGIEQVKHEGVVESFILTDCSIAKMIVIRGNIRVGKSNSKWGLHKHDVCLCQIQSQSFSTFKSIYTNC
jgi:hypothetical protein